jgi:hypothetical protein
MDRRSFLRLAGAGALPRADSDVTLDWDAQSPNDAEVRRGIEEGTYRLIGRLPETDEVVISVDSSPSNGSVLHINTLAAYASPPDREAVPDVTAPIRWPTISVVGRTPYRIHMIPILEPPLPSFTAFITFDTAVAAEVYVRAHEYVDLVALVETR